MTGRTLHIAAISAGPDGSGYHRISLPFAHLARSGRHKISGPVTGPVQPPTREEIATAGIDVLVMQRPVGAQSCHTWDALKGACKLVYECDDDILQAVPSALPHLCDERIRESVRYLLGASDLVTVSTGYLAGQFRQHTDAPVVVLPNCVQEDLLRSERSRRDRVTIGWAGGNSHMQDMITVGETLAGVLDGNPQADMHFLGWDYGPLLRGRPYLWTGWSDNVWDFYRAYDFDVAIAPLADLPFNRSKSHLKVLDAFARGVPVVATDMEPYRDIVKDGVNGYLVSTGDQWTARLNELIRDEEAREAMGRAAKATAEEWTIQRHWQQWSRAYEQAVS